MLNFENEPSLQGVNRLARPPKYKTVQQMQEAVDAYFASCEGEPLRDADGAPVLDKMGQPVMVGERPPTVTGLALALGFASRKSLMDYKAKPAFVNTITRAKARCEQYAEERLYDRDGARGAQFSLEHNFGWRAQAGAAGSGQAAGDDPLTIAIREEAEQHGVQ